MSKANQNNEFTHNSVIAYLPLEKFHILPIYGLEPDLLKQSVKYVSRDREKVGRCTLLNSLAKCLGFKGGFAGYTFEYEQKLKPFMQKHTLNQYADLIKVRFNDDNFLKLNRQDVSERLFFSENLMPKKIFTGYDFPYDQHFDDGIGVYNFEINRKLLGLNQNPYDDNCSSNVDKALLNPLFQVPLKRHNFQSRALIDIVIGGDLTYIQCGFNLLGDQLVFPRNKSAVFQIYSKNQVSEIEVLKHCNRKMDLFIQRIEEINKGWVEVIPFNENLIFLKGEKGEYDFIFRNQRDEKFNHQIYANYLKRSDVPKFDDEYHFTRWFYFEFKGHRQQVLHDAERQFYLSGGVVGDYPGKSALIKQALCDEYQKTFKDLTSEIELSEFKKVNLTNGKALMVSELVTIADLYEFMKSNDEYFTKRERLVSPQGQLDNLYSVNADEDSNVPASMTWYDVLAYINWFNRRNVVETRLLSLDEYIEISPFHQIPDPYEHFDSKDIKEPLVKIKSNPDGTISLLSETKKPKFQSGLSFDKQSGKKFIDHPPYMEEEDFQNLELKFESINYEQNKNLKFLRSNFFGEWLAEKTCIRSESLTSFYGDTYILTSKPPLHSTGKYKGMKIGFRLCYELNMGQITN